MKLKFNISFLIISYFLILFILPVSKTFAAKITEIQENEWFLGDADAPITMIEYASMSCPHCASFHLNTLPIIKEEYIDTGKVRLVFRDFPFNLPALQASLITKCVSEELHFKYIEALFKLQRTWAIPKGSKESLFKILQNSGMTENEFEKCLNNKDLENKILADQLKAHEELNIKTTPSFVINGKLIEGNKPIDIFRKTFDKILSQ